MNTCTEGQKDAAVGSSAGQKDAAAGSSGGQKYVAAGSYIKQCGCGGRL
jgi:hypothetical protein